MVFVACMHVFLGGLVINLTTPWLARLGECQSVKREVMGSSPAGPFLRVFKQLRRIKCCLCNDIWKWLDILVFSYKDEKL